MFVFACPGELGTGKGSKAGGRLLSVRGSVGRAQFALMSLATVYVPILKNSLIFFFCILRKSEGWLFRSKKEHKKIQNKTVYQTRSPEVQKKHSGLV